MENVAAHEYALLCYALERLQTIDKLHIIGPTTAEMRGGAIAFVIDGVHPHDVAQVLNTSHVAVRAGNHCAQPLHCLKGVDATTRVSIGVYTTKKDIDVLIKGIRKVQKVFS
jgi:cysteine desulfurase/selenocysteine lyase